MLTLGSSGARRGRDEARHSPCPPSGPQQLLQSWYVVCGLRRYIPEEQPRARSRHAGMSRGPLWLLASAPSGRPVRDTVAKSPNLAQGPAVATGNHTPRRRAGQRQTRSHPGAHRRPRNPAPDPGGRHGGKPGVRVGSRGLLLLLLPAELRCAGTRGSSGEAALRAGQAWRQRPLHAIGRLPAAGRHLPPAAADVRASLAPVAPRLPPSFSPSPVTYITPWEGLLEQGGQAPLCLPCPGGGVEPAVRAGMCPVSDRFTSRGKREEQAPSFPPSFAPALCFGVDAGGG